MLISHKYENIFNSRYTGSIHELIFDILNYEKCESNNF